MSGMGVTAGDYDGDGLPDIFRTNFSDERETLYRNRGARRIRRRDHRRRDLAQHALCGLGLRLLRFRQRRLEGPAAGQRPRLSRGRAPRHRHSLQGPRDSVSQSRQRQVRGHFGERRSGQSSARHSARGAAFGDYDNDGLDRSAGQQPERAAVAAQAGDAAARATGSC